MLDCCALNVDELRADVFDITVHFIQFLLKSTGSISCSMFERNPVLHLSINFR